MFAFFSPFVDLAYHLVCALAAGLAALPPGLAAGVAIIVFTVAVRLAVLPLSYYAMRGQAAQARLAPQLQQLRHRYARQPDRLRAEIARLYQREGTGMLAGCLPVLLQAPFLSVMYLLFRSPRVDGHPNALLVHDLFGAPLGSHWLSGPGPLSAQGAVFAVIFALLAVAGWLHTRMLRDTRLSAAGSAAPAVAGSAAPPGGRQPAGQQSRAIATAARFTPLLTTVMAAFLPLAAGLYLVATTAWTLAERTVLGRRIRARAADQ
jgi:YidC/Oxa1 family membrane protein insertase